MNTTAYDHAALAAAATPAGERIPGPPSSGLIVMWIAWLIAALALFGVGGPVFIGILQAVGA